MTETDWFGDQQDPSLMISHLENARSGPWSKRMKRKLRLFACGCCRQVWHRLEDPRHRNVVEVAERYADGLSTIKQLKAAGEGMDERNREAWAQSGYSEEGKNRLAADQMAYAVTLNAFGAAEFNVSTSMALERDLALPTGLPVPRRVTGTWEGHAKLRHLIRCVIGNPFRRPTAERSWLAWNNATVPRLAEAIYTDRAFDRLPILADALEDAGCTQPDILEHCRGPGPHVRGCWVVDLLLGKE